MFFFRFSYFKYLGEVHKPPYDFKAIDSALNGFGMDSAKRMVIYKILAGSLLLGNIEFGESKSGAGCEILSASKLLYDIAELFGVHYQSLENVLLSRVICVRDSEIRYVLLFHFILSFD